MESGVDHQPDGAQHVILQVSKIAVGILEESDSLAQAFGVERPAFGVRGVVLLLAKFRQFGQFLRQRDLQVMSGNSLVIRRGLEGSLQA